MTEMNQNVRDQELVITRIFDAGREVLWKAWTEREHLKRWWGPKGFPSPVFNVDFLVGGAYLNCMRSPKGKDYWSTGIYREIIEPEQSALYAIYPAHRARGFTARPLSKAVLS